MSPLRQQKNQYLIVSQTQINIIYTQTKIDTSILLHVSSIDINL